MTDQASPSPARPRFTVRDAVLGLIAIGVAVWLTLLTVDRGDQVDDANADKRSAQRSATQAQRVAEQRKPVVEGVDGICARGGQLARDLDARGLCDQAAAATDTAQPPPIDMSQIRAAVVEVLGDRAPTVDRVAQIAANVLARNPARNGRDGRDGNDGEDGQDAPPVSAAELASVVAAYCADGACRGADGQPGPPPTDEQVLNAVNQLIEANPERFRGPIGPPGPPGCPDGYAYRPVVAMTAEGGAYTDAVVCVRPESFVAPPVDPPPTEQPPTEAPPSSDADQP